ncbi:MAG: hypothetical protein KC441_11690 [Anaerolineales bacterium]|nr:hypothetical protein [Anaerolineales bacterium]
MAKVEVAQVSKNNQLTGRYEVIKSPSSKKRHNRKYPKVGTRLSLQEFKDDYPGIMMRVLNTTFVDWNTGEKQVIT